MRRRTYLKVLAGAGLGGALPAASGAIQLHVDLDVDPSREEELLSNFQKIFRPAISKQPGFVEVTLLKLRNVLAGAGPPDASYRLIISFQTEEQRQAWVKTDEHQRAWPTIEKTLRGSKYNVALFDVAPPG